MHKFPTFAVVGHPNKGKSSVVAALTQNDSVVISPFSGTTQRAQHFRLELDHKTIFELVDTPGFQRAEACLAWLEQTRPSANQRPQRVLDFVKTFSDDENFSDEVELLRPICEGAGVVYVVDGSLPYSPEYETEMEILRWTAKPRLALINPICGNDYVNEWQQALSQYFSLVRVFDPLGASFEQHLHLLSAFAQLHQNDAQNLESAVYELQQFRELKLHQAARLIIERLYQLLSFHVTAPSEAVPQALRKDPVREFNQKLNSIEQESRRELETLFLHHRLVSDISNMQILSSELMDQELWSLWGLNRKQLSLVSAAAGASLGFGADMLVGGQSLLLGSIGGGLIGGMSGWVGSDWLRKQLPNWLPYYKKKQQLGPIRDANFAFVILGRALQHALAMLQHSHADPGQLKLGNEDENDMQKLDTREQINLLKLAWQLQKNGLQSPAAGKLEDWIFERLKTH